MKINHKTLSLIIASLCGTCASAYVSGQDTPRSVPKASSGRIGDSSEAATPAGRSISTSTPKPISTYSQPTPVAQPQSNYVSDEYYTGHYGASEYQVGSGAGDYTYDLPSDHYGYSSGYEYSAGNAYHNVSPQSQYYTWVDVEALLWWGKSSTNTPTVVKGLPGATSIVSGGESSPLGESMMPGMRATIGTWLDADQNYALTGSVFGLFTGGDENTFGGGSDAYGVSFFRTDFGPDIFYVNYDMEPPLGYIRGSLTESLDLNMLGADVSLRTLLVGDTASRTDFILGYSFNRLDSSYGLNTQFTDYRLNAIPDGTVFTTQDRFGAKNEFHGLHVGLGTQMTSGRFTFGLNGKVALSHLTQTTNVSGQYTEARPDLPIYTENRGLFAQPSNIGTTTDKSFTFVPEVNAKMKYQLGRGQIGVGYSLLMFPKVVMASSQIDHSIDVLGIGGAMTAPTAKFNSETFFLHGLDLGYTFRF